MESGFMLIQQVAHLVKYQAMREMESFHLKPNQVGIMFILRSEGELSQRELAKLIGITPPSMTVALRKLEKQGYVQRKVDEKDSKNSENYDNDQGADCLNEFKRDDAHVGSRSL
ncbi:MAG: MarR family transcriptional regulator [Lachnospiraceae bacterium]